MVDFSDSDSYNNQVQFILWESSTTLQKISGFFESFIAILLASLKYLKYNLPIVVSSIP